MAEYIIRAAEFNGTEIIPGEFQEEIIRCRDCKYSEEGGRNYFACSRDESIYGHCTITNPNGFCAWAERDG